MGRRGGGSAVLIPRTTRLVPTRATRDRCYRRIVDHPPERFDSYHDWFYFLHVDPVQRWIHLVGMLLGTWVFYRAALAALGGSYAWAVALWVIGCGPFYGFGVLSHWIYDRGAAESDPAYWHITLFSVIYINLATMTGQYGRTLRAFVGRYPWVAEVWELRETTAAELLAQLIGRRR